MVSPVPRPLSPLWVWSGNETTYPRLRQFKLPYYCPCVVAWLLVLHPATSLLFFATPGQVITQDREWQLGDWKPYRVPKSQVSISCVSRRCLQIVFVKWETEEDSVVEGKLVQLCDNKGGYDEVHLKEGLLQ